MSRFDNDIEHLKQITADANCFAEVFRAFGIKGCPSAYYTILKKDYALYGIDYSHFDPGINSHNALRQNGLKHQKNLEDILNNLVPGYGPTLKKRLFATGLKEEKCECCGQGPVWMGKPLTLQLEHKDGNNQNNNLENLEILCPNCHTQTPTHSRKKNWS